MTDDNRGPFSLDDPRWPGLAKLAEESAEVIQVITKLLATDGDPNHWSGDNLARRLEQEMGDLRAALVFVSRHCEELDAVVIGGRVEEKLTLFEEWRVGAADPAPHPDHVTLHATDSAEATLRQLDYPADTFTNADPDLPWLQARHSDCGWHSYPSQDADEQERWRAMHDDLCNLAHRLVTTETVVLILPGSDA